MGAGSTKSLKRAPALPFFDWLKYVRIESDPEEGGKGGPIPFLLYDYQRERAEAWVGGSSEIILKARQLGFSWLAATYALWVAAYHEAAHVALFSKGELEVKKLMLKVKYVYDRLPDWLKPGGGVGVMSALFEGGSSITAYPATQTAGIGTTLKLALFDEAAFHAYLRENLGAVLPATGDFGQVIVLSTADPELGPSGHFYKMWQAATGGTSAYTPIFLPANVRPGRDEAWFANEQAKYDGDLDRFQAWYPSTAEDAFIAKEGLVFPQFRKDFHVTPNHPVEWGQALYRVAGIDPGGNDPTAIVPLAVFRKSGGDILFHQPYEFYRTDGVTVDSIINWLSVLDREAPFDLIFVDNAGGTVLMETLRAYFGQSRVWPAIKDRPTGLSFYRQVLSQRRLTHHENCKATIAEYQGYRVATRRDQNDHTTYITKTPVDHHADAKDACRYALIGTQQVLLAQAAGEDDGNTVRIAYR